MKGPIEHTIADLAEMLRQNLAAGTSSIYLTPPDLAFWIAQEEEAELDKMLFWFANTNLIGFAWPSEFELDFVSHHEHREIEATILAQCARPRVDCMEDDLHRAKLLEAAGYRRTDERTRFFELALPTPLPDADPRIRQADDIESRVNLLNDVQPHLAFNVAKYARMQASHAFRQDLDLVAVENGKLAAGLNAWFDEPSGTGVLEPLGCRAPYRRRGLARALVNEALRRLEALGANRVLVQAEATNTSACSLHASIGFQELGSKSRWTKVALKSTCAGGRTASASCQSTP